MGLLKKYFNQTRKPEGLLGKAMLAGMNSGHAKLADWGMTALPELSVEKALDCGCGAGRNAGMLADTYKTASVTGIDYSEESVNASQKYNKKNDRVTILQGDVSALPFDADTFDLATAFETIYFWPGLEACFSQVYRALKPGGTFLIVNESDGLDKTAQTFQKIIDGMNLYTAEEIETALKAAGFETVTVEHHKKKPWIAVAAKKGTAPAKSGGVNVQETLLIPLFGRKVCSEAYPDLFKDEWAEKVCNELDYDFSDLEKKSKSFAMQFGALEVAARQTDLALEVEAYLKDHPNAAVVNLGCGLDTTFWRVSNGRCKGYNLDLPEVIAVRNKLLPAREREQNIACDLNDFSWFDKIAFHPEDGAVFYAAGVFYYFAMDDMKKLLSAMEQRFPGAVIAFDACNKIGAKGMTATYLKDAGLEEVPVLFSVSDAKKELAPWFSKGSVISSKGYMNGYMTYPKTVNPVFRFLAKVGDSVVKMQIVRIAFPKAI